MEFSRQRHAPAALSPGNNPGTHLIGGWVGPRASLDGCGERENLFLLLGFEPRIAQLTASR